MIQVTAQKKGDSNELKRFLNELNLMSSDLMDDFL